MLRLTLIYLFLRVTMLRGQQDYYDYSGGSPGTGGSPPYDYYGMYPDRATTTTSAAAANPTTTSAGAAIPTTTSTSTTTTAAQSTTNAHPNPSVNQICPTNPGMNDRLRVKAVDMHNYRRRQLARGNVKKNNGNFLPQAGDMIELKYDCDLETSARAVVNRCSSSPSTTPSNVQENILQLPRSNYQYRINALPDAIKNWWKQVRLVDGIGMKVTYRDKHVGKPISSFTRMAWSTTRYIGCAVSESSKCRNYWYIACHYREGGNIVGSTVYAKGNPCSMCPAGTYCDNSLCKQRMI